jgi:hypothetical protein
MRFGVPLLLAIIGTAAACSNSSSTTATNYGNVVLEITSLLPRDNDVWLAPREADPNTPGDEGYDGDPEPVVIGCDRRLGVDVDVQNYYLRSPDACGGYTQCGYLSVELDPSDAGSAASAQAAATNLVINLAPLDQAGTLVGPHVLRPHLSLPDGTPFTHPFAFAPQDVPVTFAADDCGAAGAGGAGGAGDEANTSGGAGGSASP